MNSALTRKEINDWAVNIKDDVRSITVALENTVEGSNSRCRVNLSSIEYCVDPPWPTNLLERKQEGKLPDRVEL